MSKKYTWLHEIFANLEFRAFNMPRLFKKFQAWNSIPEGFPGGKKAEKKSYWCVKIGPDVQHHALPASSWKFAGKTLFPFMAADLLEQEAELRVKKPSLPRIPLAASCPIN